MSSRLSAKAGLAIRKLRLAGGWTLAQLSERSGVPLSTLSKVELGQTSLSYENLLRICKGLEIDMARLIRAEAEGMVGAVAPDEAPPAIGRREVVRAGEGAPVELPFGAGRAIGADLVRKAFRPVVLAIAPAAPGVEKEMVRDDGEAYLMVLEGDVTLRGELYAPLRLGRGDSVYFDARAGYALVNEQDGPCRVLLVLAGDS